MNGIKCIKLFLLTVQMISAHYEEDSESFHDEIKQLDTLRQVSFCTIDLVLALFHLAVKRYTVKHTFINDLYLMS